MLLNNFDESVFDTLSDVSSSDDEQSLSKIVKNTSQLQHTISQNENTDYTPSTNFDESIQSEKSLQVATPPGRSLKRQRKRFIENENAEEDSTTRRWWKRRFDLFWRFDEGIKMDKESWYSVTPEEVAKKQAKVCASDVVLDAYAGAGGNTIQFAIKCPFVIGIDNNMERLTDVLQPNARVYGVQSHIDLICGDVTNILRCLRTQPVPVIDTVFMSPPWGGPGYLKANRLPPGSASWNKRRRGEMIAKEMANPCPEIFDMEGQIPFLSDAVVAAKRLFSSRTSPRVAVYLPRNSSLGQLLKLGWGGENLNDSTNRADVRIEEYWLRGRRMALCAYIGDFELPDESQC